MRRLSSIRSCLCSEYHLSVKILKQHDQNSLHSASQRVVIVSWTLHTSGEADAPCISQNTHRHHSQQAQSLFNAVLKLRKIGWLLQPCAQFVEIVHIPLTNTLLTNSLITAYCFSSLGFWIQHLVMKSVNLCLWYTATKSLHDSNRPETWRE